MSDPSLPSVASLDAAYFERLYASARDPWNFETSEYERAKYRATIAALDGARFRAGLEIGCSIGVLTAMLAPRCDTLLSIDINARALDVARARCAAEPGVRFERYDYPSEAPDGRFDLVVLSEVGYYWSADDLRRAKDRIASSAAGGSLELVHFLPKVDDYVRDGDAVHEAFLSDERFRPIFHRRADAYRIDVLRIA